MIAAAWAAITSRVGRYLAAMGMVAGVLFAAYAKGKTDAKHNQTADRLKSANKARKIENEVDGLGDNAVSDELGKWMRDRG